MRFLNKLTAAFINLSYKASCEQAAGVNGGSTNLRLSHHKSDFS